MYENTPIYRVAAHTILPGYDEPPWYDYIFPDVDLSKGQIRQILAGTQVYCLIDCRTTVVFANRWAHESLAAKVNLVGRPFQSLLHWKSRNPLLTAMDISLRANEEKRPRRNMAHLQGLSATQSYDFLLKEYWKNFDAIKSVQPIVVPSLMLKRDDGTVVEYYGMISKAFWKNELAWLVLFGADPELVEGIHAQIFP